MNIPRNPQNSSAPATYHHGVEVCGAVRTLYIAGQIGLLPNGTVAQGIETQSLALFANMKAVLDAADMTFADVVKTTVFLINPQHRAAFAAIRAQAMGGAKNASTLIYVSGLAMPDLLVEVEAIAVKEVTSGCAPPSEASE